MLKTAGSSSRLLWQSSSRMTLQEDFDCGVAPLTSMDNRSAMNEPGSSARYSSRFQALDWTARVVGLKLIRTPASNGLRFIPYTAYRELVAALRTSEAITNG
ncbi:hypothetical protein LshimejAT787_0905620 [Lyophyllum shimeji]|uniref:Uncharacterized protein n=1 Tax=Lyophyllum shimeji TaxID=47721 RepID=A0A9P3PRE6_LYOSH|nr:hypothetical protein LshimejAT787_0905620 [Lyophyllum shimeji]